MARVFVHPKGQLRLTIRGMLETPALVDGNKTRPQLSLQAKLPRSALCLAFQEPGEGNPGQQCSVLSSPAQPWWAPS